VLAVHGQEQSSSPLPGRERKPAGGDEALLVRKREVDAVLEGPEGCRNAGEADDRVEDEIGLGGFEQRDGAAAGLGVLDAALGGELGEVLRTGGERADLQLRMAVDHLERLPSDRPRGAEEGDPLHEAKCTVVAGFG
jgi:hypothetical protein